MLSRYILLPDSSVLINIVEGCLPRILLETFEGRVYVAPSVITEVSGKQDATLVFLNHSLQRGHIRAIDLSAQELWIAPELANHPLYGLGAGERETIAIAKSRGYVAVLDDGSARKLASEEGLHCTGTLGLLYSAYVVGHVDENDADRFIQLLHQGNHRMPKTVQTMADLKSAVTKEGLVNWLTSLARHR